MVAHFNFADNIGNDALLIDHERDPSRAHVFFAVHGFFYPHAVRVYPRLVFIGDERKRQFVFGNEFLVGFFAIRAHAYDLDTGGKQCVVIVAQVARLFGAAGGVVFGIKTEGYFLARKLLNGKGVAELVFSRKGGRRGSGCEHNEIVFVEKERVGY